MSGSKRHQGGHPGGRPGHAVPARPPRRSPRRCCRSSTSRPSSTWSRRRSPPASTTSSSSPAAASAPSRTTSTATSSSSTTSPSSGKTDELDEVVAARRAGRHPLRAPGRAARPRPRRVGRPQARRRQPVRRACWATTSWTSRSTRAHRHDRRPRRTTARSVDRPLGVPARGDLVLRLRRPRGHQRRRSCQIRDIVEKPEPEEAPVEPGGDGPLRVHPRDLRRARAASQPGVGGEIQLTDAIAALLDPEPSTAGCSASGRYDIGKKIDYLRATVELAARPRRPRPRVPRVPRRRRREKPG